MKLPRAQGRLNEFMAVLFSAKAHHCNKVNIFQPSGSSVLRCFVIYLGYNPRKGAKTAIFITILLLSCTIPVRGRKPHAKARTAQENRTIPVRGRKLNLCGLGHGLCGTIPARGRKLFNPRFLVVPIGTIPVRGRKLLANCTIRDFHVQSP